MPQDSSFDIVSQVDLQEIDNAVNQSLKEIALRYDFKGSQSKIEFDRVQKKITLLADDEMKMRALKEILSLRCAKRGISFKSFKFGTEEKALGAAIRQEAEIIQGIPQDKAKEIVRLIKDTKVKVQAAIQSDQIRVSGKKKDDLQFVMHTLKESKLDLPLQFVNYR
jgi:uncharacterized protein YajQ (UPF0234 family)